MRKAFVCTSITLKGEDSSYKWEYQGNIDKTFEFFVNYNRASLDGRSIEKLKKTEKFKISSF